MVVLRRRVLQKAVEKHDKYDEKHADSDCSSMSDDQSGPNLCLSCNRKRPEAFLEESDFLEFLYKPHTLSGLAFVILFLAYEGFFVTAEFRSERHSLRSGLLGISLVFLVYCALQLRDNLLRRPHPVVWRVVQGIAILYLLLLIFLLMQDATHARRVLHIFDETLGPMPKENTKLYAQDCRIYTPENPISRFAIIRDTADIFMIAHFLGWFVKALIFRDWTILWLQSIFWEILEISFQHMLPNFKECWWDHWILDVALCNFLGMWCGMKASQYFAARKYNWTGVSKFPTLRGKLARVLNQFTPFSWTSYTWAAFDSYKRLMQVIFVIIAMWVAELNAFFLKFILWVPPSSILNWHRLAILTFIMFPCIHEFYQYLSPNCKRMGANLWITLVIVFIETLIIIKFSLEDFSQYNPPEGAPEPIPSASEVYWSWFFFVFLFNLGVVLLFYYSDFRQKTGVTTTGKWWRKRLLTYAIEALLLLSIMPILHLGIRDAMSTFHDDIHTIISLVRS